MLFERIFKKIKNKIAVLSIHVRKRKKEKTWGRNLGEKKSSLSIHVRKKKTWGRNLGAASSLRVRKRDCGKKEEAKRHEGVTCKVQTVFFFFFKYKFS